MLRICRQGTLYQDPGRTNWSGAQGTVRIVLPNRIYPLSADGIWSLHYCGRSGEICHTPNTREYQGAYFVGFKQPTSSTLNVIYQSFRAFRRFLYVGVAHRPTSSTYPCNRSNYSWQLSYLRADQKSHNIYIGRRL
jgi:hypothetical protein